MRSRMKSGARNQSTALARRTCHHIRQYVDPETFEGACEILQLASELATARVGALALFEDHPTREMKALVDALDKGITQVAFLAGEQLIEHSVRHIPSNE